MIWENERKKNVPLAASFAPAWHATILHRSEHFGHGAELFRSADGEHHEDSLTVAVAPDSVDAIVATRKIGNGAIGEAVSHVRVAVDFHADEPRLCNGQWLFEYSEVETFLPRAASRTSRGSRERASVLRL